MSPISPIDVKDSLEYLFGSNFDACHVVMVHQLNASMDLPPYYMLKNITKSPVSFNTFNTNIPPGTAFDLAQIPRFKNKKVRELKNFIAECQEIDTLKSMGFIEVRENIMRSPVYEQSYLVTVYEWKNGEPKRMKAINHINADQVSMEALRAYIRLGKDYRCISCLRYPHGLIQYFLELFPDEIDTYRKEGIDGYEKLKYKFLQEFENTNAKLLEQAEEHDRRYESQ